MLHWSTFSSLGMFVKLDSRQMFCQNIFFHDNVFPKGYSSHGKINSMKTPPKLLTCKHQFQVGKLKYRYSVPPHCIPPIRYFQSYFTQFCIKEYIWVLYIEKLKIKID